MKAVNTILSIILISAHVQSNAQCDTINHWECAVLADQIWKYDNGFANPDSNWIMPSFNDASWNSGPGGFGYGDNDDGTIISPTLTVYLRKTFEITNKAFIQKAMFHIDFDDGFVAYINGQEFSRYNMGDAYSATNNTQPSQGLNEAMLPNGGLPKEFEIPVNLLMDGQNTIAIEVHNESIVSSDLSSNAWVMLALTNAQYNYYSCPAWFVPPINLNTSHLPLIIINTNGAEIPDEPKISANLKITNSGETNSVCGPYEYDGNIAIEIRGSSSQEFPKKQYSFETQDQFGNNNNVSLLGMPAENDWILYAPYSDKSLIRNVFAYQLGSELFPYSPRTKFCEVILNGEYQGIYVLTEKIKRDLNRVDINKLKDTEISGDNLTGGYILLKDRTPEDYQGGFLSLYPSNNGFGEVFYQYEYPKAEDIQPEQADYIKTYIRDLEDVLKSEDFSDNLNGYLPYVDIQSFVNYFIIQELSKDIDAYRLSAYMYKNRESLGGKLKMGPVWDFNVAFGNSFNCGADNTAGNVLDMSDSCGVQFPFWWERLPEDNYFMQNVICNWNQLRNNYLSNENVENIIDGYVSEMGLAVNRNFDKWKILDQYVWPNPIIHETYENEVAYLKQWILDRMSYLDQRFAGTCELTSIEKQSLFGEWTIGPNPFNVDAIITGNTPNNGVIHVQLINMVGQVLANKSFVANQGNTQFTVKQIYPEELAPGVYIMQIQNNHGKPYGLRLVKK